MVSVGEGASAPGAASYGGGGAGGKATRNQFRRSRATPYDRPPTARRNPSLLSKLVVDPIKNLASSAAHRFFASVTGKRLTPPAPPPLPPETIQEFGDGIRDAVTNSNAVAPEPSIIDGQKVAMVDTGGISELEHLLRQKTFTKSEIDHLTELLQSKAVDLQANHNGNRVEASLSDPVTNYEKPLQLQNNPLAENGTLREISHGVISTPGINTRVLDEDVATPAELAKAYMGSRPSKVSPSMLGLRSQAFREGAPLRTSAPFTPKFPMISLAPKVTPRQLAEKSFASARSQGRSAIYSMARSPYSRLPRTALGKETEPRRYGNEGYLLPSSSLQDQDGERSSTKLVLKRRSSVLDDDVGSVGPMRSIRQKRSLSSQRFNIPATRGIGGSSGSLRQSFPPKEKLSLTDEWKYKTLKMVGENEDNCAPSTSYAHVPPKSTEMAARILQQLEKVAPKEKSAESKLITAMEKSPAKLTTDMLRGQALRSLEDVNSPKLLQTTQSNQRSEDLPQSNLVSNHREPERIEQNGPKTLHIQHEVSTPTVNHNSTTSAKDFVPSTVSSDSAPKVVAERPQKKRAFTMSAHEDFLDLDEDTYSNGRADAVEGRGKSETSFSNHSSVSAEKVVDVTTAPLLEVKKSPPEPMFSKKTDFESRSAAVISGEKNGVAFPALHSFSTSPSLSNPQLTSMSDGPKQENKVPGPENSSVPSLPDLSAPKPSFWAPPSQDNLSSSGEVIPTLEVPASDKHKNMKALEGAELQGRPENLHSSLSIVQSSTVASSVIPENLSLKNGTLSFSPSTVLSSPSVASTGFASQSLAAGTSPFSNTANFTNFAASTFSSVTSNSIPFGSSGTPTFQFGSSVNPSNAVSSSVSTTSDAVLSVGKTNSEKEGSTNSLSNTPLGGTSFATGSSIFGLSSTSAASTKSASDTTASGFVFGTQSSDVVSGAATISKDVPFQFGSSVSSPAFSGSGVSSFMSSSNVFTSSAPANKLFSSGGNFGLTSSTSAVETKSADTGSGPSGLFGFGTGASAASSGANAFSLSSGSSSTFSFGMSSSATSSLTNAPVSSSSTPPAIFSFGATSSSGNGMVSSSTGGTVSAIFGASTLSSSSEINAASSSGAASVPFGSNWKTPNSSPFGASSSSPPVFSFGASSSSSFSAVNTAPVVFGSTSGTSPSLGFSFTAASAGTSVSQSSPFASSPSIFGNSTSTFTAPGNNDQMSMEDSMAEDVQATAPPAVPVFGQQPVSASPGGFAFGGSAFGGSSAPQSASPFQFGGQQSQVPLPGSSPFQASGSMEFNAGGSFSLGSGGGPTDKANRRIVRPVRNNKHRKK